MLSFYLIILCRFVSSVIPPGSEDLKGNEVETIIEFKRVLGIDDPDAASMHMEVFFHVFWFVVLKIIFWALLYFIVFKSYANTGTYLAH